MRSLRTVFRFVAVSVAHPEWGPARTWHAFADCHQITGNGCRAVPVAPGEPEAPLCWTCVERGFRGGPS